jgi:putative endonuclease
MTNATRLAGQRAYHSGDAAEQSVARLYTQLGYQVAARRWRSSAGEIDLIVTGPEGVVFVEVKAARTHDRAAERLSRRQMERIMAGASEYLSGLPSGQLTNVRFDVALADGTGQIEILENAFGQA